MVVETSSHIGHGAVLHGCSVRRDALVGMNAVVMDEAEVGEQAMVAACAFVPAGTRLPPRTLSVGTPARVLRELRDGELQRKRARPPPTTGRWRAASRRRCTRCSAAAPEAGRRRPSCRRCAPDRHTLLIHPLLPNGDFRLAPAPPTSTWDDRCSTSNSSDDERAVRDAAYASTGQQRLAARAQHAFRHEQTDPAIFREMGELGLLGPTIPEANGGAGLNYVCYGLIAREVERRFDLTAR